MFEVVSPSNPHVVYLIYFKMPPEPATSHSVGSVVVESSEVNNLTPEERVTEFEKIISQLKEQMKKSAEIAIRFKTLGDIKNAFV